MNSVKKYLQGEIKQSKTTIVMDLKNGEKIYPSIYKAAKDINKNPRSIYYSILNNNGILKNCRDKFCSCQKDYFVKFLN